MNMNQAQSIDRFNKKSNLFIRNVATKKSTGKALMIEDIDGNPDDVATAPATDDMDMRRRHNDERSHVVNDGNNFESVVERGMEKSNTPIENMNLNDSVFSVFKPNKNYVVESHDERESDVVIKNSTEDTFHRAVSPSEC